MPSWPRIGRPGDSWPGLTITGVVILAASVLADAVGELPRGGPRLVVGLILGFVVLTLGYVVRRRESRDP